MNNAGLYVGERILTEDGYELTIAVNHLAYFLLTNILLPHLDREGVRIVNVASRAHNYGKLNFEDMASGPSF